MTIRVLHVIPSVASADGGPSRAVLDMARALGVAGISVDVVSTDAGLPEGPPAAPGLKLRTFPSIAGRSFKWSPALASWLDHNARSFDVVHIHAVFNHSTIAAARACWRAGIPYVLRPLGTLSPWSMSVRARRKGLAWGLILRRVAMRAQAIHYTSDGERAGVEASLGLERGVVIPLGVDAERLRAEASPLPARGRTLVSLGRLDEKKRLDLVLDAFARTRAAAPDAKLVIAGTGDAALEMRLRHRARALGLASAVEWPGWVEGAAKAMLLARASAAVLVSFHENFGLAAVEAMALGTPPILARDVDLATQVAEARAGWVTEGAPAPLATTMLTALEDVADREARGSAAMGLVDAKFVWPRVVASLIELYERTRAQAS